MLLHVYQRWQRYNEHEPRVHVAATSGRTTRPDRTDFVPSTRAPKAHSEGSSLVTATPRTARHGGDPAKHAACG